MNSLSQQKGIQGYDALILTSDTSLMLCFHLWAAMHLSGQHACACLGSCASCNAVLWRLGMAEMRLEISLPRLVACSCPSILPAA